MGSPGLVALLPPLPCDLRHVTAGVSIRKDRVGLTTLHRWPTRPAARSRRRGQGEYWLLPGPSHHGSFGRNWIYPNGPSLVPKAQAAPSRDARGGGSAGPKPRYDWPMCWPLSGFRRGTTGRADERGRSGRTRSRTVPGHRPPGLRAARTPCAAAPPGRCGADLGGDGPARPGEQPQGHRRASPRGPFSLPAGPRHRSEIRHDIRAR